MLSVFLKQMCISQSTMECFFPCVVLMESSKWDLQPFLASEVETVEQHSHGGEVPEPTDGMQGIQLLTSWGLLH